MFSTKFETEDGSKPPTDVLAVFRYFRIYAIVIFLFGFISWLPAICIFGLSLYEGINPMSWTEGGSIIIEMTIEGTLVFFFFSSIPYLTSLGVKNRNKLVYYLLIHFHKNQTPFIDSFPGTLHSKHVKSNEFNKWFI